MPDEVLQDSALNAAIAVLPANYNFEVRDTFCNCEAFCRELQCCAEHLVFMSLGCFKAGHTVRCALAFESSSYQSI